MLRNEDGETSDTTTLSELMDTLNKVEHYVLRAHTQSVGIEATSGLHSSGMIRLLKDKAKRCESSLLILRRGLGSLEEKLIMSDVPDQGSTGKL